MRTRIISGFGLHDSTRVTVIIVMNDNQTQTPLALYLLQNGFVLNPYDEVDEDFWKEMNN